MTELNFHCHLEQPSGRRDFLGGFAHHL